MQDAAGGGSPAAASEHLPPQNVLSTQATGETIQDPAERAHSRVVAAAGPALVVLTLALVLALSFRGGGYLFVQAAPLVLGWFVFLLFWVVFVRPSGRPTVPLLAALVALGLQTGWIGLSILWSVGPDLSWIALNYALLYLAVGVVLALTPVTRLELRVAAYGYLVVATVIAVYALLGKVLPDQLTHAHLYARLLAPVDYWNVLAVMLVMALPVALALAARRTAPALLRAASASAAVLLLITLFFTFSRGGFLALGVALIVFFAAARERLSALVSVVVTFGCAIPALYGVRHLATLFHSLTDLRGLEAAGELAQGTATAALRTSQGHELGIAVLVALAAAFGLQLVVATLHRRLELRPVVVRRVGIAALAVVVLMAIGAPLVYMERNGGVTTWVSQRYQEFVQGSPAEQGDSADRLMVVSSNGRIELYRTVLRQLPDSRLLGTGAGTFAFTNYRYRDTVVVVKHAHSQWFNALSELGYPGLALFVVFVLGLAVAMVWRLVRLRRDPERGLLAAGAAAAFAFLFHISGDWDWDMAAITIGFFILALVVCMYRGAEAVGPGSPIEPGGPLEATGPDAARAAPEERRLPWPATVFLAGALLLACVSWLLPWLSARAEDDAHLALIDGRYAAAADHATRARALNPLAIDPLVTLSIAQQNRGLMSQAADALQTAIDMQPANWWLHHQMGLLHVKAGRNDLAAAQFVRALQLNPLEPRVEVQLKRALGG